MRRKLFTAASVLSLLLCLVTVVLWVRSYWVGYSIVLNRPDGSMMKSYAFGPANGTFHFGYIKQRASNGLTIPVPGFHSGQQDRQESEWKLKIVELIAVGTDFRDGNTRHAPFDRHRQRLAGGAILPLIAAHQFRAHEEVRCTSCSYDLTGNISGVCPECGTAVAIKAEA